MSLAPFGFWPAGLMAAAGLFYLLQRSPQRAPTLSFYFALGQYGVGASWVYVSIREHGNASVLLAGVMVVVFVLFLAALFGWTRGFAYRWLHGRATRRDPSATTSILTAACAFIATWSAWEWLTTWVLTGFPWLILGQGHLATWLGAFIPIGGAMLVSLLAVASACTLLVAAQQVRTGWRRVVAWAGAGLAPWFAGLLLTGVSWVDLDGVRSVALVQNNIEQAQKWQPQMQQHWIERQLQLSEPHWGVDVLVWPEAALTAFEHQAQPLLEQLGARGREQGTSFVLGVPMLERDPTGETAFYNGVRVVGDGAGRYRKRHLTPFGEYVPLAGLLRGLIEFFDLPMSRSKPGPWRQPLLRLGADKASIAICYEVAYPDLVADHAGEAAVLLTISNDAWFGRSIGPHQHLQIAQTRAKENGRYMLRGAQNGITAVIDEQGRVLERLPQFVPEVLRSEFRTASGITPYVRWGNLWLFVAITMLSLTVLCLRVLCTATKRSS